MAMTERIVMKGRTTDAPALAIGGRLKGFGPEEEKASRKAEVKETEAIRQIKAAWKACGYNTYKRDDENYRPILHIVENLQCTAKDLEEFSLSLEEFQHEKDFAEKAGHFLSALINSGKESDYVIHTQHLVTPPDYLGYKNGKNIIVKGDAGLIVGSGMKRGSISVRGNTGHWLGGLMQGGSITVEGNAGDGVGYSMKSGSITIDGNAGYDVGAKMKGGEIHLESNYENIADDIDGGRIFHKVKLIYPGD
jgi:hypothetical protein